MLKTLLPLLIVASCTWAAPAAMKKTAMKTPCFQGDVILPEGYEVKPNSCLFISFKENIQCDGSVPCHNPDLASIKIENPVFVNGKLRYRADITTAQRQHRDNDVLAIAQLSNGYCKTTGAWVRDGDLYQEFADSFLVKGATFGHVEHDIKLDVYEEPEMMADAVSQHHKTFEEPCFHGDVILPKGFELKTGSCLFIRFQEALQCMECEIPTLASVEMEDLVVKDNKIAYKAIITTKPTDPRVQSIAYLSNGHCKDSAYKNGDLHQEYADEFDLGKNLEHLEHDIKLDVYKAQKAHYGEEKQEQQEERKEDEDFEEQERCDKPCTRELSPVCGTDGVTYPNECVFNNAKCSDHSLQFAYDGKCKDCPKGVEEVECDVDPCLQLFCDDVRTAVCKPNKCGSCKAEWFKAGKKIQCEKPKCSEVCPFNYDPQCGSDGVTYGNLCSLETVQCKDNSIRLQSEGECPLQDAVKEVECEEGVPHVSCGYEPCAQLYCKSRPNATCVPNFCGTCKAEWFEQGEKVKCEETVCSEICTLEYEPYCGSDGVTYPNLCTLKTAQCKVNSIVNFGQGACEEREQTPVECVHACTANYKPVCGSDGATYSNKCEFENARCSNPELRIRNHFTCQDDIKETPQGKEVKIHGAVVLPPFTVLTKGSCLKIEVIKNIMCESCENPPLATLEVKDPEANSDGGIAYRMKFVLKEGAVDDFTITATVNNGWCPEDQSEWIRNGDFKNAKAEHINSKTLKLNIVMEKYIQPAASPQQGGIRLHGIVNLPTGSEGLKKESCLKINVRPDILCVGPSCNISLIKEIVLNNVAGQTEIPYEIILPALTGKFRVSAVANDGWCGNNDEWIRTGDYLNDIAHVFDITAQSTHVAKDVELIKNVN